MKTSFDIFMPKLYLLTIPRTNLSNGNLANVKQLLIF